MKVRTGTIVIALLFATAAGGAFVHAGIYNIAATEQHTAPVYWLLEYAMRRSVKLRSAGIEAPDLSADGRIRNGFLLYRDKCLQCHGAPGVAPNDSGFGLRPAPANLVAAAREWKASEIYWVVRYGIKMSGMPAWEYRLGDDEIWDVVAFVRRLPAFSPREYAAWNASLPAGPERARPPAGEALAVAASEGNAEAGKHAIQQYLCATCHKIPGITGATKQVGPPLDAIATRKYIAGILPNTRENMILWLRNPKQFAPQSAMPDLGVTDKDARDIAAYLHTLKG